MLNEFKDFINRGNVVDLAVAVVIGGAFGLVVTSFNEDVLMQVLAAFIGEPDFSTLTFTINGSPIYYGNFLTAVVNFVIVAFALFLVVKGINAAQARVSKAEEEAADDGPTETDLLAEIRDLLRARG